MSRRAQRGEQGLCCQETPAGLPCHSEGNIPKKTIKDTVLSPTPPAKAQTILLMEAENRMPIWSRTLTGASRGQRS